MKKFFAQPLYDLFRKLVRNPKYRWVILAGGLLYLISPFDISPDVLPIIGWLDDGVVATLLVTEVTQLLIDRRNAQKNQSVSSAPDVNSTIDVKATV